MYALYSFKESANILSPSTLSEHNLLTLIPTIFGMFSTTDGLCTEDGTRYCFESAGLL